MSDTSLHYTYEERDLRVGLHASQQTIIFLTNIRKIYYYSLNYVLFILNYCEF